METTRREVTSKESLALSPPPNRRSEITTRFFSQRWEKYYTYQENSLSNF